MQTVFLLGALLTQGVPSAPQPLLQALVVTGANNHDWEWTSASLAEILQESGRFEVAVTTEPAALFQRPETHAPFDVYVLDYNGPRWGEPAESNFLKAVSEGKGVVVVHAANNAFPGWIGYEELIALAWRDRSGHGAFHAFDVEIVDRGHPLTQALPDLVAHPDELYHRLMPMHGSAHQVLGRALSTSESGGTGAYEPLVVVKDFGAGRVFHTALGHVWRGASDTRASHADPQFKNLIARGAEWAATGAVADEARAANRLEPWDERAGWRLLFDGTSGAGWTGAGGTPFPPAGWSVEGGALRLARGAGADLFSEAVFGDFELAFEWKVGGRAESGVAWGAASGGARAAYEVRDEHGLGVPPGEKALAWTGAWNRARIVARAGRVEHWLNGRRVVAAELAAPPGDGPLRLVGQAGEAWFRSLYARDLARLPGRAVELFDGRSLVGLEVVGPGTFRAEDGEIHGESRGADPSYLLCTETCADFFLELDVLVESGSAGLVLRGSVAEARRIVGPKLVLAAGEGSGSGGLGAGGRAPRFAGLEHSPEARAAFRPGAWNRISIEAVGPSLRVSVNGVPTVDSLELVPLVQPVGRIALETGAGSATRVRLRNLRLAMIDP